MKISANLNLSHMRDGHQNNVKNLANDHAQIVEEETGGVITVIFDSIRGLRSFLSKLNRRGYTEVQSSQGHDYYIEE